MSRIDVEGLGEYIREQRNLAQLSLRQLAARAEVSNPYLSQVERGLRKPSAEILGQIAKALTISAESLYIRAGILEDNGGYLSVPAAITADSSIGERQKRVLLEIYAAFQAENRANGFEAAAADNATDAPRGEDAEPTITVEHTSLPRVVTPQAKANAGV